MNKKEIFICQLAFGGYPVKLEDQKWAKETKIYKQIEKEFNDGKYKQLWEHERKIN